MDGAIAIKARLTRQTREEGRPQEEQPILSPSPTVHPKGDSTTYQGVQRTTSPLEPHAFSGEFFGAADHSDIAIELSGTSNTDGIPSNRIVSEKTEPTSITVPANTGDQLLKLADMPMDPMAGLEDFVGDTIAMQESESLHIR